MEYFKIALIGCRIFKEKRIETNSNIVFKNISNIFYVSNSIYISYTTLYLKLKIFEVHKM